MDRSRSAEFLPGQSIPVVCAEDLVTMKAFAGRPQDWIDVRGILVRQETKLDWSPIEETLPELLDLIEAPDRFHRLRTLRDESK